MKRLFYVCSLTFASFLSVSALTGCGLGSSSYGVVGEEPVDTQPVSPPIQGSVFGGHAPLVGARVYVLTPNRTTNYGLAKSLMNTSISATAGASPVTPDVSGTGSATNGMYYITTDGVGGFNLTGNYACTSGQPVYIAAVGGSPENLLVAGNTYPISTITVNSVSTTTPVTENITATTSAPAGVYSVGEQVIFRQSSGTLAALSGISAAIQAVTTSGGTTKLTFTAANVGGMAGTTYTFTAPQPTAVGISTNNTAVVNMAALGTCPSSGNFSSTGTTYTTTDTGIIPYIYMNEVSTVAAAYGMAGFGKDAFHIGADLTGTNSTYVANSLTQAIFNSFLLYDITGSNVNNTSAGEGHIGRQVTPEGNGFTPQNAIDTLGNILAACVDSGNTASTPSVECSTLLGKATSDGTTTGTAAADTSAAIFNIAHYPAGVNNTSFVSTLYHLPSGILPFTPSLSAAPTDFTLAIAFEAPAQSIASGGSGSRINGPQVIAVDGNEPEGIWIGDYYGPAVKIYASGTPDYTTNNTLAGYNNNQRSVTVDGNNNIWVTLGDQNQLLELTSTGANPHTFTSAGQSYALAYPMAATFDAAGYLLVSNYNAGYLDKFNNTAMNQPSPFIIGTPFSSAPCIGSPNASTNTVDPNGNIYVVHQSGTAGDGTLCVLSDLTGFTEYQGIAGYSQQVGPAYISVGPTATTATDHVWSMWGVNAQANSLLQYRYGAASGTNPTIYTGGGLDQPCSTAVDGAGTVWVGNGGNSSLSAFALNSTTGQFYALSPAGGFSAVGGYSNCGNPAIDRAGDVWVAYQGAAAGPTVVYELVGAAIPTITPVATATKNGTIGTRPK